MRRTGLALVSALASVLVLSGSAQATEYRYDTAYSVSLGIMPIARLTFHTEVRDGAYEISGRFRSSGLVDFVREISADSRVSGKLEGDRFQPQRYHLDYRSGRKESRYTITYANGSAVDTKVEPAPKPRPSSWVPVTDADLKVVLDPIGALLIPGNADVCAQTLPIYDGESRLDLVLSPGGTAPFSAGKASGEAIVCSVRYVPVSGYRKGRKDIEHLKSVTGMEIWFAKTATLKLYAPVYAKIPTRYGTVHVSAEAFDG
ncbi:MAG: DUF3108 domain-containing protein [Rhizobium sp.]|nr:DUF3108 domain-containing protein [Rhizobium sp.]